MFRLAGHGHRRVAMSRSGEALKASKCEADPKMTSPRYPRDIVKTPGRLPGCEAGGGRTVTCAADLRSWSYGLANLCFVVTISPERRGRFARFLTGKFECLWSNSTNYSWCGVIEYDHLRQAGRDDTPFRLFAFRAESSATIYKRVEMLSVTSFSHAPSVEQ